MDCRQWYYVFVVVPEPSKSWHPAYRASVVGTRTLQTKNKKCIGALVPSTIRRRSVRHLLLLLIADEKLELKHTSLGDGSGSTVSLWKDPGVRISVKQYLTASCSVELARIPTKTCRAAGQFVSYVASVVATTVRCAEGTPAYITSNVPPNLPIPQFCVGTFRVPDFQNNLPLSGRKQER